MTRYVGLLDGEAGAYGVAIVDCPGAVSMGKTMQEALENAATALREWLESQAGQGAAAPPARSIDELRDHPDVVAGLAEGAAFVLVPSLADSGRPVKANLSLDAGLLEAIDAAAKARGLTRSGFLASAARDKIANGG